MLGLDRRQRAVLADKAPDMANLVAAAVVIGFAVGEPAASAPLLALVTAIWIATLLGAVVISRDRP